MKKTIGILLTSLALGIGVIGINKAEPVETSADFTNITINEKDKKIFDRFATIFHLTESDYTNYLDTFYDNLKGDHSVYPKGIEFFERYPSISEESEFLDNYIKEAKLSIYYDFLFTEFMFDKISYPSAVTESEVIEQINCLLDHFVQLKDDLTALINVSTIENIQEASEDATYLYQEAVLIYDTLKTFAEDTYNASFENIMDEFESHLDLYFDSASPLNNKNKEDNIKDRIRYFASFINEEEMDSISFDYFYPTEPGFGGETAEEILGYSIDNISEWFVDEITIKPEYVDLVTSYAKQASKAYLHFFTTVDYMFNNSPDDFLFENLFLNQVAPLAYKIVIDFSSAMLDADYPNILILAVEIVEDTQLFYNLYLDCLNSRCDEEFDELDGEFDTIKTVIEGYKSKELSDPDDVFKIQNNIDTQISSLNDIAQSAEAAYIENGIEKFNSLHNEVVEYISIITDLKTEIQEKYLEDQYSYYEEIIYGIRVAIDVIENVYEDDDTNYTYYKDELTTMGNTISNSLERINEDLKAFGSQPSTMLLKSVFLEIKDYVAEMQEKLEVNHRYTYIKDRYDAISEQLFDVQMNGIGDEYNYSHYKELVAELNEQSIELQTDLETYIEEVGEVTKLTDYIDLVDELVEETVSVENKLTYQHNFTTAFNDIASKTNPISDAINLLKQTYVLDPENPQKYLDKTVEISGKIEELDALLDEYIEAFPSELMLGIIKSVTVPSYKSQIEQIETDINYRFEVYKVKLDDKNIRENLDDVLLIMNDYSQYEVYVEGMEDFLGDIQLCIENIDDLTEIYGEHKELNDYKDDFADYFDLMTQYVVSYKHVYLLNYALAELDTKANQLNIALQGLYVALYDFEGYENYLIVLGKIRDKANESLAKIDEYIETLGEEQKLVDKKSVFNDILFEANLAETILTEKHNEVEAENDAQLIYNGLLSSASELAGSYNLNDSQYEDNITLVNKLISDFGELKTKVEGYVEEFSETDIFNNILKEIPFIVEDLENLKDDIELFHVTSVDTKDVQDRYDALVAKYNDINNVYKLDDVNYQDYLTRASKIKEDINTLKTDILGYMDECGTLEFFDNINTKLSDLRVNCDTLEEDISHRHYENEINAIIDESSGFENRVDEISRKFKSNGLNYDGDIEECSRITEEIDEIIAKIDSRADINSDQRLIDLRAKLADLKVQVNTAKEDIQKDHTIMIVIIVVCSVVFVLGILALLYFFGFKKRFLRKSAK